MKTAIVGSLKKTPPFRHHPKRETGCPDMKKLFRGGSELFVCGEQTGAPFFPCTRKEDKWTLAAEKPTGEFFAKFQTILLLSHRHLIVAASKSPGQVQICGVPMRSMSMAQGCFES